MNKTRRKTTKEFIEESIKKHGDRYDYSKVNYVNSNTKVRIICPEHGEFWQKAHNHLQGHGCPKCNTSKLENAVMNMLTQKKCRIFLQ